MSYRCTADKEQNKKNTLERNLQFKYAISRRRINISFRNDIRLCFLIVETNV